MPRALSLSHRIPAPGAGASAHAQQQRSVECSCSLHWHSSQQHAARSTASSETTSRSAHNGDVAKCIILRIHPPFMVQDVAAPPAPASFLFHLPAHSTLSPLPSPSRGAPSLLRPPRARGAEKQHITPRGWPPQHVHDKKRNAVGSICQRDCRRRCCDAYIPTFVA
eukprot:scaffold1296_cov129-Isochrysis_galbana.AAC.1